MSISILQKTTKNMISKYQHQILKDNDKSFVTTTKLIMDYVIKFRQAKYMPNYFKYIYEMRMKSNNNNENRLYELLNDSLFGHSMLNKVK